ncbi:hypothetical protein [Paraglaciecola sp. 25GB23A]|uniref:hypothetical protein n=1 Tax=Paraglaciecola sp. 25GB23A TaxID=3156068 RepID=UPI0032AEAAC3
MPSSVTFADGEWFYVGFQSTDFAVSADTDRPSAERSWIFSNTTPTAIDPNALGASAIGGKVGTLGFASNFLIRANATMHKL